jgi:hypothetical protein
MRQLKKRFYCMAILQRKGCRLSRAGKKRTRSSFKSCYMLTERLNVAETLRVTCEQQ